MATPIAELLHAVLTDATVRADATRSPRAFLDDHGWEHLDAADLQEAFLVLADGAPPAEAAVWIAGGDAVDPDGEAHGALASAIGALPGALVATDPSALDDPAPAAADTDTETDDIETDDDTEIETDDDDIETETETETGTDDETETETGTDDDTAELTATDGVDSDPFAGPAADADADADRFADLDDPHPDDAPGPGELGDGWDDLI